MVFFILHFNESKRVPDDISIANVREVSNALSQLIPPLLRKRSELLYSIKCVSY